MDGMNVLNLGSLRRAMTVIKDFADFDATNLCWAQARAQQVDHDTWWAQELTKMGGHDFFWFNLCESRSSNQLHPATGPGRALYSNEVLPSYKLVYHLFQLCFFSIIKHHKLELLWL
jgi:hypothetical protein